VAILDTFFDIGQWTQLEGDHPMTIWTRFGFLLSNGPEEKRFPQSFQPIRSHCQHLKCGTMPPDTFLDHSRKKLTDDKCQAMQKAYVSL